CWLLLTAIELNAGCVEPLCLYLEGLAVFCLLMSDFVVMLFSWYRAFLLAVLSPFCLFLRASFLIDVELSQNFNWCRAFSLAVLSLFYLFLRASFALLGCVEPLPMSLGTKLSCSFHLTFFGFAMLLGHLVEFSSSPSSFFFPSL
ncbi:hypothetical protein ACXVWQ_10660, partial [Haemophilus sp. SZY H57]